ncbi:MAG: hypothetical protein KAT47_01580 [Candidatus Aegiribacteria sp.]|nr:hypothetical protein [Candidatus Aegiribacteria sp.]
MKPARLPLCGNNFLFLTVLLLFLRPISQAEPFHREISYLSVPEEIIEAEIDMEGNVHILLPGLPHLLVYHPDETVTEFDLQDVMLPGGFCVDERWGWYVSDELSGRIFHIDVAGETAEFTDSRGRPGDICIAGFAVLYISRADGVICSMKEPADILVRLDGSGSGQLSASGNLAVYSSDTESYLLDQYSTPERLPEQGVWALSADELIVLKSDSILSVNGEEVFMIPEGEEFRRISCSPDGNRYVLWSPGRGEVLILR